MQSVSAIRGKIMIKIAMKVIDSFFKITPFFKLIYENDQVLLTNVKLKYFCQ